MCGITGIFAFNEVGRFFGININKSMQALEHRGPDAGRLYSDHYVNLGHKRLSIIDLSSEAHQPMVDTSKRYVMVFNGEIYNYKALRKDLEKKGVSFQTQSDTEVLLYSYIHEGEACLNKLHGFFSFAIYDKEEQSIFIARDRYGIKPLVYFHDEDKLIFASEMNALLAYNIPKEIDYTSLYQYFQLSYIPAPQSIFKNVRKLSPGHAMKVTKGKVEVNQWYKEHTFIPNVQSSLNYEDAQKRLVELLDQSVQERMVSDVPLGAFLSGGIDSSVVVALASRHTDKLNTFSIGYQNEPMFDETHYAKLVAKKYNTEHIVFKLTQDDFYKHVFDMLDHYGEPFADSSALPVYILCQETKKKATVALSGDGADEVFAGYNKYFGEWKAREGGTVAKFLQMSQPFLDILPQGRSTPLTNKFRQLNRFAKSLNLSPQERYWFLSSWRSEAETHQLLSSDCLEKVDISKHQHRKGHWTQSINGSSDDMNDILYADTQLVLPNDMLHKVDSMSMSQSLEVRVPFLDHRVVEFAFSLPSSYKINQKMKKRILQDAVRPLLPAELYKRPKQGFEVPLSRGYKRELKSWIETLLDHELIVQQGIFNPEFIEKLKLTIFHSKNYDQNQVWAILAFQHWWKKHF